jgi:molybdenum cofactor biosynthesis enzyme MoaA
VKEDFVDDWRRRKSAAFDRDTASWAKRSMPLWLWGDTHRVYRNANLSVYSAQRCNARCPFCVEELRPASRGGALERQKRIEPDDEAYFGALEATLRELSPLRPSVSVTGGEPSKDPRLPRILRTLASHGCRKRTMTTNGSGLLDVAEGRELIDWITLTGVAHLNISRAHPDIVENGRLMRLPNQLPAGALRRVVSRASKAGTRIRLSCVLLHEGIADLPGILGYIAFARSLGVSEVIFRQLMRTDPRTHALNSVVRYSDEERVILEPLLDEICASPGFRFVKQIVGYYYYVEVFRFEEMSVVFEEADLGQLETTRRLMPGVVHELVFHPNATLASTWQPWDGVLGPRVSSVVPAPVGSSKRRAHTVDPSPWSNDTCLHG